MATQVRELRHCPTSDESDKYPVKEAGLLLLLIKREANLSRMQFRRGAKIKCIEVHMTLPAVHFVKKSRVFYLH